MKDKISNIDLANINLNDLSLRDLLKIAQERKNETEVIELKENIMKPADISDYITQFSNNRGGLLVLGLTDDGRVSGKISEFDKDNENLIQEADLVTTPSVGIRIKAYNVPNESCYVIAIQIPKPTDGIMRISSKGALVKRVASRRAIIQPIGYSYERQPIKTASIEDLDKSLLDTYLSKLRDKTLSISADLSSILSTLQILCSDESEKLSPTVAGMILFGRTPDVWVNGTRVNIIRYSTAERSDKVEDATVITGSILRTIEESFAKVRTLIRKPSYQIAGKRQEIYEYPYPAIREAINNAFFHNDYSIPGDIFIEMFPNRLEIKNMGVPIGGTRLVDLVDKPKHRNRIILKVLSELGFIEGWGIGLKTMLTNLRNSGLPEPKLLVSGEETRFVFHTHAFLDAETLRWLQDITSKSLIDLNPHQILALGYAKHQRRITNTIYQRINDVSTHVAGNELRELCSCGLLIQLGRGKSAYYTLTELFNADEVRLEKYFPREVIFRLTTAQRKILTIIETFSRINTKQIFYQSGYSDERGVKRILNGLVKLELVKRTGKSQSDPSAYYEINKEYRQRRAYPEQKQPEHLQLRFKL